MQTFRLHHRNQHLLYESSCRSLRECVEEAFQDNINLDGINLAYSDLSEINLDGTQLNDANFEGANLTGANISEAVLLNCTFLDAALYNTCFCHSDLSGSNFSGAVFGGADLAGASLENCTFSDPSALNINFTDCKTLSGTVYKTDWKLCPMSKPPLIIAGLDVSISIFDQDILIGQNLFNWDRSIWKQEKNSISGTPFLPQNLIKLVSLLQSLREADTGLSCANIKNQPLVN